MKSLLQKLKKQKKYRTYFLITTGKTNERRMIDNYNKLMESMVKDNLTSHPYYFPLLVNKAATHKFNITQ